MATKTNNLGLSKAELTDAVRSTLTANNGNFDIIDDQIARLKANQIVGTASGTEIVVEDSAEMESILKISGNSEQDSRSGKNLFPPIATQTLNGITCTQNSDGTLTLNGTATADAQFHVIKTLAESGIKVGQKYTLSTNQAISGVNYWLQSSNEAIWVANQIGMYQGEISKTGVISEQTATHYKFAVQILSGTALNNTIVKVQLEEGSTATSYEPYGVQPSPDYPSEIRSVKSKSDNLFDKSIAPIYKGVADIETVELDTGVRITTGGQVSSSFYGAVVYLIKDVTNDVGKTVRLKANMSPSNSGLNPLYNLILCDSNGGNREKISAEIKESGIVSEGVIPTLTGTQTYLGVRLYSTAGGTSGTETDYTDFTNIMITIDSEIKNYQPYGYVPVEVKVEGKNLFDESKIVKNKYLFTGEALMDSSTSNVTDYMFMKANTRYDFTYDYETLASKNPRIYHLFDLEKKLINYYQVNVVDKVISVISTTDCYIRFTYDINCTNIKFAETKDISLPLGDIELRSVPSGARDTFVKKDGVWNKYEKVGAFIITQDMFNNFYPTQYGLPMANFKVPNIVSSWKSGDALFTSYKELKGGENPITSCFSTARSNVAFEIFDERFTDAETAKNLMNGETGITELKTHNYIPITDTALIQALDSLEQLILHKGYNRITVTSVNGVKAQLDLSYIKDINAVLDNINAIILTLGGGANV